MDFLIDLKDSGLLRIHVIAGVSKNEIVGSYGGPVRLKVKINALAQDGKANKEIINFFAKSLKISKSKIEIKRGATSSQKDLLIHENYEIIALRLNELLNLSKSK